MYIHPFSKFSFNLIIMQFCIYELYKKKNNIFYISLISIITIQLFKNENYKKNFKILYIYLYGVKNCIITNNNI